MIDRVTEYAKKTIDEGIMGELHILACKRHLEDLKRQGTKDFPYIWNAENSERILNYAETLTIAEGFELKPVKLLGSQCHRQQDSSRTHRRAEAQPAVSGWLCLWFAQSEP